MRSSRCWVRIYLRWSGDLRQADMCQLPLVSFLEDFVRFARSGWRALLGEPARLDQLEEIEGAEHAHDLFLVRYDHVMNAVFAHHSRGHVYVVVARQAPHSARHRGRNERVVWKFSGKVSAAHDPFDLVVGTDNGKRMYTISFHHRSRVRDGVVELKGDHLMSHDIVDFYVHGLLLRPVAAETPW